MVPDSQDLPASEFYDAVWSGCASLDAASPAAFHRRRLVVRWALREAPGARRILDVGCGTGELVRELAGRFPGAAIAGADVSERALERSRQATPRGEFFTLDLASSSCLDPYPARLGSFDLVTCCEVLEHLADDVAGLRRLHALLAPDGCLIVTVPGGSRTQFDRAIGHLRHYGTGDLEVRLQHAGLVPRRVTMWGFPFHSAYRTAVRLASALAIPAGSATGAPGIAPGLGRAYRAAGLVLRPAFYFNLSGWGQQVIAIARRPGPRPE
jgi:SAM-dependent methyltransferase